MSSGRFLIVTAADFGIGLATWEGILALASRRLVRATVLLVNSPYVEGAARSRRTSGIPLEMGWHPCLTLDRSVSAVGDVPSLWMRTAASGRSARSWADS
jgi:predicted glycoside hydrolase/deacetylase ChbG (UPF0249 family)